MAKKEAHAPDYFNKKANTRSKPCTDVSFKAVYKELRDNGYVVIPAESDEKNRKAKSLALNWFYRANPDAAYSNSGRSVKMGLLSGNGESYDKIIDVPVSDGHPSKDALRNLRDRTGLALDPKAAEAEHDVKQEATQPEAKQPEAKQSEAKQPEAKLPTARMLTHGYDDASSDKDNFEWDAEDDNDHIVFYTPADKAPPRP